MSAPDINVAGWAISPIMKRAHYFPAGELHSLCNRWALVGHREDTNDDHPDNCAACKKRIAKHREKIAAGSKQ